MTLNNWVQATPVCALLFFPSQRTGAPDPEELDGYDPEPAARA